MNRACLLHENERECSSEMAASPCKSLFGKALLCAVSVLKGNVQDKAATSCVQREISVFMTIYERAFLLPPFCSSVSFEEMMVPRLKSSILVVFCKSNCCWSLFRRKFYILG